MQILRVLAHLQPKSGGELPARAECTATMTFDEFVAAVDGAIATLATRTDYHHGIAGTTASWRRIDRYRFAELRRLEGGSARLVMHRTAREAEEETFQTALPEHVDLIARRIVTDLQL
ncbi:MAG TPA: hypothetical protein VMA36_19830 [Candidatus Limnocylindria bacterium]|nr:hypothetical protein [Candidatus Limnocylindria bacterium]